MDYLINKIINNKKIEIQNIKYDVLSLTKYYTIENKNETYYKAVLNNHRILVILDDEVSYLGEIVLNLNYVKNKDNTIVYNNRVYKFVGKGNQRVLEKIFGEDKMVEKDCSFTDYEYEDNIISLGILTNKNNEAADVVAKYINNSDIK